jgi:hypothetical protein
VFLDGHNGNLEIIKAAPAEVRGKPAPGQGTGPYWKAEKEARKEKSWDVGSGGQVYQPEALAQNASELT